ncbi:MAG: domain containing protein [Marmoricola sp.]|nr:domain containing protein [Marmoricola sp.]
MRPPAKILVPAVCAGMLLGLGSTPQAQAVAGPTTQAAAVAPAPITFVGSAMKSANVKAPAIIVPSATQAGDTMLLTASLGNATTATAPSGWTLRGDQSATTALRSLVWARTATATDAGKSVPVAMETIHKSALGLSVYRGVDAAKPVTATASTDVNTATHTTPAVTVPGDSRVVSFWAERGAATTKWMPAAPLMRSHAYSTGGGMVSAAVADPNAGRSGAVAGSTATTNAMSARGVNWSIVLQTAGNLAPQAAFTNACTDLVCSFDASGSSDADGTIVSQAWTFGDATTAAGQTPSHTYAAAGTFPVQLTVTDDDGVSTTTTVSVTVTVSVITTVYGMNFSPGTSYTNGAKETAAQQVNRIVSTYGTLGAAKVFYQGNLPASFNKSYEGLIPGKIAAVCFKPNQVALANGSLDAAINGYINSIPAGTKIMLVNWQEPDDEMWKDHSFTVEQHRAATERLIDIARANPAYAAGRVEVWDVYMGYSLDVGRWEDKAASPRLDGIGWDYYWNKPTTAWSTDPTVALKKMADKTKALGIKDYGVFETGDNPHENDANGSGRAEFWTKVYTKSRDLGYDYMLYFNAIGTTGDHRILPETSFGGPVAAVLRSHMTPQ